MPPPTNPNSNPIAIIGAGIVGLSTALHLLRHQKRVIVIDRVPPGAPQSTSYGNAGVLARCAFIPVLTPEVARKIPHMLIDRNSPLYFRWSYLPRLLPWLLPYLANARRPRVEAIARALAPLVTDSVTEHKALAADTPAARRIQPADYLFAYSNRAAFDADHSIWQLRAHAGFTWQTLNGDEVQEYEPALANSPAGRALRFAVRVAQHAHINSPGDYIAELAAQVMRLGGQIHRAEVMQIRPHAQHLTLLTRAARGDANPANEIPVSQTVIAAGAWSLTRFGKQFGVKIPLQSERGYHLHFRNAKGKGTPTNPLMIAQRKISISPMGEDLRLSGVTEFAGIHAAPRRAPLRMLHRNAREFLPHLFPQSKRKASAQKNPPPPPTEWLGHRPTTADSLPILGASPRDPRVFFACGHQHIGLTAGAKSGRIIAELLCHPDLKKINKKFGVHMENYRADRNGIIRAA